MKVQNVSTLLTISIAIAVHRYYTACIAWWRRFVAFIKATKRRHRVSTRSNSINRTRLPLILGVYFIVRSLKKSSSYPNNKRGVTHQTDEKHLNNMPEYFVVVVNIGFNRYNNRFLLHVINSLTPMGAYAPNFLMSSVIA
jgi:hypothetical protein